MNKEGQVRSLVVRMGETNDFVNWLVKKDSAVAVRMYQFFKREDPDIQHFAEAPWYVKAMDMIKDLADKRYDAPLVPRLWKGTPSVFESSQLLYKKHLDVWGTFSMFGAAR